jgi:hypothetical protein
VSMSVSSYIYVIGKPHLRIDTVSPSHQSNHAPRTASPQPSFPSFYHPSPFPSFHHPSPIPSLLDQRVKGVGEDGLIGDVCALTVCDGCIPSATGRPRQG